MGYIQTLQQILPALFEVRYVEFDDDHIDIAKVLQLSFRLWQPFDLGVLMKPVELWMKTFQWIKRMLFGIMSASVEKLCVLQQLRERCDMIVDVESWARGANRPSLVYRDNFFIL